MHPSPEEHAATVARIMALTADLHALFGQLDTLTTDMAQHWTGPNYDDFSANIRDTISQSTAVLGEVAGRVG